MADTFEIRLVADDTAWDAFVRQAVGGTVFSTSAWLRCAAAATGGQVNRLGCYRNGYLVAGISGLARRRMGLYRLETPELTPHTGLLLAPVAGKGPAKAEAVQHRACTHLTDHLAKHYDRVFLVHAPSIADVRPFTWQGWDAYLRYTYRLPLGDSKALWERIERRTRTAIRKAEKLGYHLRPTSDVALFRRQYEAIYANQANGSPIAAALAERFVAAALEAGLAQAYEITCQDGPAAIVAFVEGFDTTYAWAAGADPAYNHTGAISLLYWQYYTTTSHQYFDFVGANMPSIAFFKRGFGCDLVPYYAVEGYKSGWVKRALGVRQVLRG
ncbi:MAG: GNAT family N-acetyltransferase [Gemmatimonadetes bacterium]|nr:GNAT family N-acetyltransferase [Gemmatimonadota bacterium]